jgi:pimeloyl-ACP methyl ester carboxylesterase
MPTVEIPNGPTLAYTDTGGVGIPIIFSHGLFMSREMFGPQMEEFSKDHRCISWDERAHGETIWEGPFTYWDSADDLILLADHLGIEKFIHFGFSQGGLLGLRAAMKYPERIVGLIQCSTQAGGLAGEEEQAFRAIVAEWVELGPTEEKLDFLVNLILGPGADEQFWREYWKTLTPTQLNDATYALYDAEDIYGRLGKVTQPTLVIHGLADISTPLERGVRVSKEIPDSRGLLLVDEGPHAVNLTHADQVNEACRTFVGTVAGEHESVARTA